MILIAANIVSIPHTKGVMMAFRYAPPGGIDDLAGLNTRDPFLADWHASIQKAMGDEIRQLPAGEDMFFSEVAAPATSADLPITWNAFPLSIMRSFPNNAVARWDEADTPDSTNRGTQGQVHAMSFRQQDEYCEWFAYRSTPGGPIARIVFTAEAPEYWITLAKHDFNQVVELYRKHVSPAVQPDDLKLKHDIRFSVGVTLKSGTYNPYNKWNTSHGVMHLTHPANTLHAEINLAAQATIPRHDATGTRVTEARRLACGSTFGDANRSSDPNIGLGVNLTVLPGTGNSPQSITLANPVGLYIDRLANGAITDVDGNPLPGWFTFVRGVAGRGLMAVLQPPAGATISLSDIRVGNRELTHGGQVAERLQMVLYGKTANLGKPAPTSRACVQHCCRPNDTQDVGRLNLGQLPGDDRCSSVGGVDAFPELLGLQKEEKSLASSSSEAVRTPENGVLTRFARK